ncbi:MAG TPA: ATP-binding cassette domain-containing protein [Nitrospirae bacterium]|nr:ATP-binding cassette domain-containing protein [Nitrospirota bacterium]
MKLKFNHPLRLTAKEVSFTYPNGIEALRNINLDIYEGDFIGLLGSNGSGKTTLLKCLDGIIKSFKGNINLDDKDIRSLSAREIYSKIGLVFQNPDDQLFASTVFEDVAFGPINMGFDASEVAKRVYRALEEIEMADMAERTINSLSFGQKKRVCIAGLLSMGQSILLLDEPTAGLDPVGEYKMMNLLTKLNREQRVTIVMATHSVDLVPVFINKLFVLSDGAIIKEGTSEEIFTAPTHMEEVKLRMPQIGELLYELKHKDKLPIEKIPLTIGEARRQIMDMIMRKIDG